MPVRPFPRVPTLQCIPTAQNAWIFFPFANRRKLWDTYTGEALETLAHEHIVRSVDISSSQNLIATGGHEKRLRLFDIQQISKPRDIGRHDGTIKSVVWDHKDAGDYTIITSGDDKKVAWWDTRSVAPSTEHKTEDSITSMEQSIDYNVITVTAGRTVLIFDSATYVSRHSCIIHSLSSRTLLKTLNFDYEVSSVSVHPGFERLVVGSASDPWVRIHDYETGRQLGMDKQFEDSTLTDIFRID
jgi:serine-threonine kinase receptor-associated protein